MDFGESFWMFFLVLSHINNCDGQVTECNNNWFGENDPKMENNQDPGPDIGYLMLSSTPKYTIDCCGVVTEWNYYIDGTNGSHVMYFQIWRPVTGAYELVGTNQITVSNDQEYFSTITTNKITVKSGDRIGWWTSGNPLIPYKSGGGEENDNLLLNTALLADGSIETWSTATPQDGQTYQIRVTTGPNTPPTFSNLPQTVTVSNAAAIGTSLYTLIGNDVDTYDVPLLTYSMVANTDYAFNTTSLILTTAASLSGPGRTNLLQFVVVDQCAHSSTATLTVSITNTPPVIHNLPNSTYLSEDTVVEELLLVIDATDAESDVVCSLVTTGTPFDVRLIPATVDYGIFCASSPNFDYVTQNQYDLTISCTDGSLSDTGTYIIYLTKNAAPTILNLQNATTISTNSTVGSSVFQVETFDAEGDDLTYTMTCDPTGCPFDIYDSGEILVTQDLTTHTVVGYDIQVTVSDGKNTVGPSILTVTLLEINDPVLLIGAPHSTAIMENTAVGTVVHTMSYSDQDSTQAHTFTMSSSPASGLSYFTIDSTTGVISTIAAINYETIPANTFAFTVTVADPVVSDSGTVMIDVINVNEPPAFSQASYTLSANEGVAGASLGTPGFGITDPDVGDTYRLMMDCGAWTGYFQMDTTSGEVFYQSNYDLDLGILPSSVACTVTVVDGGGLNDTAGLTITILDTNDNVPIFSPGSYSFFVNYYASAGTIVGTVSATDADAGAFGVLTFTLDQSSLLLDHFIIDQNGGITVRVSPSASSSVLAHSSSVTITATASDAGGLSDTASVIIVVSDTTTTVSTTTTERFRTFFEDSRNVTWFVFAILLTTLSAILVTWVIYTCRVHKGCPGFRRSLFKRGKGRVTEPKRPRKHEKMEQDDLPEPIFHSKQPNESVRKPPPPLNWQSWRSEI